jgi:predicted permease
VQPIAGRDFRPDEEAPQAPPVAILGHHVWTSRYNADPGVIGHIVRLNGVAVTIVGVMPKGFRFPLSTDIWQPLAARAGGSDQSRESRTLSAFARLRDGVTIEQARAEVDGILADVGSADSTARVQPRLILLRDRYVPQEVGLLMRALLEAVLFVLLIACADVANLFLARTCARTHEFAARVALGATRWDIVRQLVIENMAVSIMATIVGFVLSVGAIRLLWVSLAATKPPFWLELRFDARVFAFGAAVALIAGLFPVLVPALRASRTSINEVLKEGGSQGTYGARATRWSHAFITAELALTLVLLCGAAIVMRSFLELSKIDFGIETRGLTVARLQLPSAKYDTSQKRSVFYDELGARLRRIGAFSGATVASGPPGGGGTRRIPVIPGRTETAGSELPFVAMVAVGSDYFRTLPAPIVRGRAFTRDDEMPGRDYAVIDERVAATYFALDDPIGRRIALKEMPDDNQPESWLTIVGVSRAVRQGIFQDLPVVYLPFRAQPVATLLVRGPEDSAAVAAQIRAELRNLDPDLPIFEVQSLDEFLSFFRWPQRVFGGVFAILAVLALCLSAVGLAGVASYSVTQRTREIGIRTALGARAPQILWVIMHQALTAMTVGVALGVVGAAALSNVLPAFLVQAEPADAILLLGIAIVLVLVALAACFWPARRAVTLDPMRALRSS